MQYRYLSQVISYFYHGSANGFSQTKVWVQASVAQLELKRELREADWMQKFESLQLDQDTKDVLRYVVQYHTASTDSSEDFEDFIPGKGTGIVILLHGEKISSSSDKLCSKYIC